MRTSITRVSLLAVCAVCASALAGWGAQRDGEESISVDDVPAAVKEVIDNLTKAGIKVEEIQRETEDGKAVYEIELEVDDDEEVEIELDEGGKLLDLEIEDDDEDDNDDE